MTFPKPCPNADPAAAFSHHDQISSLDARETSHFAALTTQLPQLTDLAAAFGRSLHDTPTLARLQALDHQSPNWPLGWPAPRPATPTATSPPPHRRGGGFPIPNGAHRLPS